MKKFFTVLIFMLAAGLNAQDLDYNTKKGYVAEGYDVTEYFNNKAIKGDSKFVATLDGVKYKFANKENMDMFKNSPEKYIPQYGGYCAYAIGVNGKKVGINPNTYEIRDDKLYLFYNAWGMNTLTKWQKEGALELKEKADINWQKIRNKNK